MSADDHRPRDSAGKEGVPGAAAIGGGADVVSLLPPPSNARVDGLDARASGLATFVVNQAEVLAPSVQRLEQASSGSVSVPVQILRASRARQARRRQVRRGVGAGVALGALAAAGFVAWTAAPRPPATLSYTVDGAAPPAGGYVRVVTAGTSRSSPSRTGPTSACCRAPALASSTSAGAARG